MVTDLFGSILEDLGKALGLELKPDANNSCIIKYKEGLQIQLEIDKSSQYLIIGTDLGTIPQGHYRERLFAEALKANYVLSPRYGVFAYSKQADKLTLFEMMNIKEVNATKVNDFLTGFKEKALRWKDAISRGDIPVAAASTSPSSNSGMFGLSR